MPDALAKRRMLANIAKPFAPGYGSCLRCAMPWKFTEGHSTPHGQGGCFPLCEHCWAELTPEERLPYYEDLLRLWERLGCPAEPEKADIIRSACLAGL